ncbi:hypothetical protein MK139_15275, partial [bacterium]|nr:hypothetical protein [bacterium]
MQTVICYGDSNTWGYDPETKDRFRPDVRWMGVLADKLGDRFKVTEEGLNRIKALDKSSDVNERLSTLMSLPLLALDVEAEVEVFSWMQIDDEV